MADNNRENQWVKAYLVLESGERFEGSVPKAHTEWDKYRFGEVVFNTGMVGYTECMTDPSYCDQILTFTYPMIGNYGVFDSNTWESQKAWVSGIVISDLSTSEARDQAINNLLSWCTEQKVVILKDIDTRALTLILRDKGVVSGCIILDSNSKSNSNSPDQFIDINSEHLVKKVSIENPMIYSSDINISKNNKKLIAVDCGMKANILRHLQKFSWEIKRVPFDYDYSEEDYDAVFISNGPGDPERCVETIDILKKAISKQAQLKQIKPIFGICLGAQIMALAIGAKTYKLQFGHRSQNQPCLKMGTDQMVLTSANHGYAIDEKTLPENWSVSYKNLNDNSVQGICHKTLPYSAVQFHPEAAPGPEDTEDLFEVFWKAAE